MDRVGVRGVLFAPLLLCSAMVICALVTGELAGVTSKLLYLPYFSSSLAITFVSLLVSIFWWVLHLARSGAEEPLRTIKAKLRERVPYLVLPALVFPLFLVSFTAVKTAIPFLVGYSWDPFWAQADRLIFGDDAWRIAHHWLGGRFVTVLDFLYSVGWGLTLVFVMALVPLNASPKFTGKFYTAMLATWMVCGGALAYLFSAAGPVFASDAAFGGSQPFADLQASLDWSLAPHSPIRSSQQYLISALHSHVAVKGGGISAMPSMHLGAVSIYVLGARQTRWFMPAVGFWLIIFISSAYFGYHYWVDGIVAAGAAAACWAAADRLSQRWDALELPYRLQLVGSDGVRTCPVGTQ
jgi:PAP2 superfamily